MKQGEETALEWSYIESWCAQHGTLDVLAEAKAAAAPAWEDDAAG